MTGAAETEAEEFSKIYGLEVLVVPTNRPMIRDDFADLVFRGQQGKWNAVIDEIVEEHEKGRPVLVGTISVAVSEMLGEMLKRQGIKHNVLNAKYHEKEAEVIAQAGQKDAVTIATNMAGRGIDIQLRGRAGRQGDPGSSRFYLSLEDDLLRIFASERVSQLMLKLGMEEGIPIEHRWVTRSIENAQKKVEAHNFDIRKQLLEYDDVMNKQREVIYQHRRAILQGSDLSEEVREMIGEVVDSLVDVYCPENQYPEEWDFGGLAEAYQAQFGVDLNQQEN